jgi:hypothetical protein
MKGEGRGGLCRGPTALEDVNPIKQGKASARC